MHLLQVGVRNTESPAIFVCPNRHRSDSLKGCLKLTAICYRWPEPRGPSRFKTHSVKAEFVAGFEESVTPNIVKSCIFAATCLTDTILDCANKKCPARSAAAVETRFLES